jgi:hypothetical protein
MSETGELFERIERVINAADVGARLAPDIHRDWMTGARSALAILRCRVIATPEAVDGARPLAAAAEQAAAALAAAEQRGAERERAVIAAWLRAHADESPSGTWDAYALRIMAADIQAGVEPSRRIEPLRGDR